MRLRLASGNRASRQQQSLFGAPLKKIGSGGQRNAVCVRQVSVTSHFYLIADVTLPKAVGVSANTPFFC